MTQPSYAIEIESVRKSYGSLRALNHLSLTIGEGEFFGLLGPNGAGKTTLIHSIVGLVKPDAGEIRVFGHPVTTFSTESRKFIGFAPQESNVDRFFNVRKTLELQAGFYGYPRLIAKQRAEEMLEQFRLTEKAKLPFYKLSGGMQKRMLIARAMMSYPKILILDEPSAGIDVEQRRELWEFLRGLNRDGTTILLTTHYMDEAEFLCERISIISKGKIAEEGTPLALLEKHGEEHFEIVLSKAISPDLLHGYEGIDLQGTSVIVRGKKVGCVVGEVIEKALSSGARVIDVRARRPKLEDVFVSLT